MKSVGLAVLGFAGAIAGAVTGIYKFTESIVKTNDEIAKTSRDLGISGEQLQEWRYSAELAGINTDELSTSLKFFSKNLYDAASTGKGQMADSLKILNIELTNSQGQMKDSNSILLEMADKLKGIEDPALRAKISTDIFGRSGIRMTQLLGQGSDALKDFAKEARDLGLIVSNEVLDSSEMLNDNITRMQSAFQGLGNILGNALIPIVNKFVTKLTDMIKILQKDFIGVINNLTQSLTPLFDTVLNLLKPIFKLLNPVLKIVSNLISLIAKVLNGSIIPFINTLINMLIPILNDINILTDLFIILEPALNFVFQILILIIKSFLNPAIMKLKIMLAILQPIIKILSIVFTPIFFVLNKILGVINEIIDRISIFFNDIIGKGVDWIIEKFNGIEDVFKNIFKSVSDIFNKIINKIIDGINFLIEKINLLPGMHLKMIDKIDMQNKLGNEKIVNDNKRTNNINMQNNININGVGNTGALKQSLQQSAGSIFNLELKKLIIDAGGL
jgi:hypothetical protein